MFRSWSLFFVLLALAIALPVAAIADFSSEEQLENRKKIAALRRSPEHQERLRRLEQEAHYFLSLPPTQRERLVQLDRDLHREMSAKQAELYEVMRRYADWLERLPAAERRSVIEAPNKKVRLERVAALREQQWLAKQPKAVRDRLERWQKTARELRSLLIAEGSLLSAPARGALAAAASSLMVLHDHPRALLVARLKTEERERTAQWQIALRHWDALLARQALPMRLSDFGDKNDKDNKDSVETFVKEYLLPVLSPQERDRLEKAEGQWPRYPRTLVQLADQHPMALPGPHGPTRFVELPEEVRSQLNLPTKKTKGRPPVVPKALKAAEGRWPDFAIAVTQYVNTWNAKSALKKQIHFRHELWPTRFQDLSFPMREFLAKRLQPKLDKDEFKLLKRAEGKWPAYPQAIQELATRHYLTPPWLTLPGARQTWDGYRLKQRAELEGFPEVPKQILRDFAFMELSPKERATLKIADDDPAMWQRLAEEYFKRKPAELDKTRKHDFLKRPFGDPLLTSPEPLGSR